MKYRVFQHNPASQFIQISLTLSCQAGETMQLQLPAWRPGRYEMANYAQFIKHLNVLHREKEVPCFKITKDLWTFTALKDGVYEVRYDFFARQMDAGGSWSDPYQLYINFVNFIFEVKSREKEKIHVTLHLPDHYQVATALPSQKPFEFLADDFQHLVDSPLIASPDLNHFTYRVMDTTFHIWIQGEVVFRIADMLQAFKSFTETQIEAFGDFPATDYHFMIQLLPYKHYHGVEHAFSTVITFGPADILSEKSEFQKLVGVSSHELYHFWNVCRIRPKELVPYDLSKESYLDTGLVLEGVTTYMGDLFLLKSGFFTLEEYLKILSKKVQREFDSLGWENQSIAESSFDLWLDGYKEGIPDKKVSIYNRGALISLCLDLILLDEGSSLQVVMREMWLKFGKNQIGYTLKEFESVVSGKFDQLSDVKDFFNKYVYGKEDVLGILKKQLLSVGISISESFVNNDLLHCWGIRTDQNGFTTQIHPDSNAFHEVMIGDKILKINGKEFSIVPADQESGLSLLVERHSRKVKIHIPYEAINLYPIYVLNSFESNQKTEIWSKSICNNIK
jgi:predicted metalloprotease with PDZ domain